ncbi:hypothetical protein [Fictibacillus norfolkensis]|uniref:Uncharacterized protein n=1 Tax=Fictibacillus norfolkensis TaxID=2762233 RepID=A0ABR8SRY1_9BACL|nr:hypothetical protein [Fictibacillus norfolkensis]MBD7966258.1 hypothetical protein [Fictibacillus norfolkensis]
MARKNKNSFTGKFTSKKAKMIFSYDQRFRKMVKEINELKAERRQTHKKGMVSELWKLK